MIIDFKEIPRANTGLGDQDSFEMFSRDFLSYLGYEIVREPSRGMDGGLDIKVKEIREINEEIKEVFWLVSCKHYTHSTKSISTTIESNIYDRVVSSGCNGFIGMYTSIASTGLNSMLEGLKSKIEIQLYDNRKIEDRIVGFSTMESLFLRYFPKSYAKWKDLYYYTEPIKLLQFLLDSTADYRPIKDVLRAIFGSVEGSIKPLRKYENLESLFSEAGKRIIIIEDLVYSYMYPTSLKHFEDLSIEGISLIKAEKKLLSNVILERYNFVLNGKLILHGMLFENEAAYSLYPNALVVNDSAYAYLDVNFSHLNTMLK